MSTNLAFPLVYFLRHMFPQNKTLKEMQDKYSKISLHSTNDKIIHRKEIERVENLSEEDFVKNYLNKSRPVVFSGQARDWECCKRWDLNFLEQDMKDVTFRAFENIKPHKGELPDYENRTYQKLSSPELSQAIQNEQAYLRFSTVMDEYHYLVKYLDNDWLKKMRRGFFGVCCQNFIGAKGRKTTLHSGSTPFFYIMAYGEKKWMLTATANTCQLNPNISHHSYFHTDADLETVTESSHPGLIGATIYHTHLKQGDILFVPSWMWHQVENLTHSWGVSYNFSALRSFLAYPLFVTIRILFRRPSFFTTLFNAVGIKIIPKEENMPEFFYD